MWVWCLGIVLPVVVGGTIAVIIAVVRSSDKRVRIRLWSVEGLLLCAGSLVIALVGFLAPIMPVPSQFSMDGYAIYRQCDPQWGDKPFGTSTICSDGCGQAAMAMVITALTGDRVTPDQTAEYGTAHDMYIEGNGSSWLTPVVEGEHWGLRVEKILWSVDDVNRAIARGGMVWVCGDESTPPTSPFTLTGHCIAIHSVTWDGKWKIFDSAGEWVNETTNETMRTSDAAYDPQAVIAYSSGDSARVLYKN